MKFDSDVAAHLFPFVVLIFIIVALVGSDRKDQRIQACKFLEMKSPEHCARVFTLDELEKMVKEKLSGSEER